MIRRLVRFALRQRLLVLGATGLLILVGMRAFIDLPIDAFPDVEDIHVQIISQWSGHAAEEIERSVTLPIEREMNGAPHLTNLRSTSMFGLSVVTLTFDDETTDNAARQQSIERLLNVSVPPGVRSSSAWCAALGLPDASMTMSGRTSKASSGCSTTSTCDWRPNCRRMGDGSTRYTWAAPSVTSPLRWRP